MEEQARTKDLGLGQREEEGRREIQFIAGRVQSRLVLPTRTKHLPLAPVGAKDRDKRFSSG